MNAVICSTQNVKCCMKTSSLSGLANLSKITVMSKREYPQYENLRLFEFEGPKDRRGFSLFILGRLRGGKTFKTVLRKPGGTFPLETKSALPPISPLKIA